MKASPQLRLVLSTVLDMSGHNSPFARRHLRHFVPQTLPISLQAVVARMEKGRSWYGDHRILASRT